jgi:hypothetical protein
MNCILALDFIERIMWLYLSRFPLLLVRGIKITSLRHTSRAGTYVVHPGNHSIQHTHPHLNDQKIRIRHFMALIVVE